jgi:hypothetical protein
MRFFNSRTQWPTYRSGRSRNISDYEKKTDEEFKAMIIKLILISIPLFFITFEYYVYENELKNLPEGSNSLRVGR